MNLLADIQRAFSLLDIPIETGVFGDVAPDCYVVVIPMTDSFSVHADNAPGYDIQEARLSLYSKGNYMQKRNAIIKALLAAELTITDRKYLGYENETGYHHYAVDVAHYYEMEE